MVDAFFFKNNNFIELQFIFKTLHMFYTHNLMSLGICKHLWDYYHNHVICSTHLSPRKVFLCPFVGRFFFFFFFNASTLWSNNSTPMYLSRKINTHVHQRTCTLIFMADLFIVSKTQKQFNYLLTGAQMNKSWCVSNITLELSNSNCWHCTQQLKQLILSLHAITWIKHKTIILRTCTHIPCESDLQWYKPGQW